MVRFTIEDISSFKNEIVYLQDQVKQQISLVYYEYDSIIDKLYRAIGENESFTSTAREDMAAVNSAIEHNNSMIRKKYSQIESQKSQAQTARSEAQAKRSTGQKTGPDDKPDISNSDKAKSLEDSAAKYEQQTQELQSDLNRIAAMNRCLEEYKHQIEKSISTLKQERLSLLNCKEYIVRAKEAYDYSYRTATSRIFGAFQKTERALSTAHSIVGDYYNIVGSSTFYGEIYFEDNGRYLHDLTDAIHCGVISMNIEQRALKSKIIDYGYAMRDDISRDARHHIEEYEKCISQAFDLLDYTSRCCGIMYEHIKQYLFIGS